MTDGAHVRCRVSGGETLPVQSGGSAAMCSAIEQAMADRLPGTEFSAEILVLSPSRISCRLTVAGRELPEQQQTSVDRPLIRSAFDRFARSLADQAAEACGK